MSVGMNRPGALAEKLVVPAGFAWPISGVAETDLVCVEPTTVAVAGIRRLGVSVPDRVLVVGVGALGLLVSLVLQEQGTEAVASDVNPDRVALAGELGVRAVEDDDRFQAVVDTVGSPASIAAGIDRLEVGGNLLCLGLDSRPFELNAQTLVRRQIALQGSLTYDHPRDFESAIRLITEGFHPGRVVTDEHVLDEAQTAFETAPNARGKTWIRVGSPR